MKLLFDQNLSPRLIDRLTNLYPESAHVYEEGLDCVENKVVWEFAHKNDYLIVSKDSDFSEMSIIRGFPPKVIWIRRGNCSTQEIEELLRKNHYRIEELHQSKDAGVLLLY
jgi:predicted nuclease of predicted toxin-antitoxin system